MFDPTTWTRWMELHVPNERSRKQYEQRIRALMASGSTAETYVLDGRSPDTRNMRRNAVKHFRAYCQRERCLLPWFPANEAGSAYEKTRGQRRSRQYVSREDMMLLLKSMRLRGRPKEYIILLLTYAGALRRSEVRNMNLQDVMLDSPVPGRSILRVLDSKHGSSREVPLDSWATDKLVKYLVWRIKKYPEDEALVPGQAGKRYDRAFGRYARELAACYSLVGLPVPARPSHNNRAMKATHLDEAKVSVRAIQSLLGHANLNTTQIYLGTDIRRLSDDLEAASQADSRQDQPRDSHADLDQTDAAKTQHTGLSFPLGAIQRRGS